MLLGTKVARSHWLFNAEEVRQTAPRARAARAEGE
jgi:hypothetical protein